MTRRKGEKMKVETIRLHPVDPSGDTIRITDGTYREVYFKRSSLPYLIKKTKRELKRHEQGGD